MQHLKPPVSLLNKYFCSLLLALALFPLSNVVMAENPATELTDENLDWVKKTYRGEWRMNPDVDWNKFSKIQLDKATVEFRKHWARDQRNRSGNRPTEKDLDRVKSALSEQLNEVFTQELTINSTYTLSDKGGEDVMRITPKIVDLNIYAPDRMRNYIGYSLTDSKGSMTLELEIHDSLSGTLLASARENREDPKKGWLEWTTRGTNKRAAGFILSRWGRELYAWLDEARTGDPGPVD